MRGMRQWLGLGLLVVVILAVGGYALASRSSGGGSSKQAITVRGLVGGEKVAFLEDPAVQKILNDRYGITVDATKAGSIEMVQGSTTGQDFLWPSSQVALDLYKQRTGGSPKSTTTFDSPIVLYAWVPVADALIRAGLVKREKGIDYVTHFDRLARMILQGKPWSSVGLRQVFGPISIFTTDPNKSNSGLMFAGLLANTLDGNQVVTDSDLPSVLPDLRKFYSRLGYLETSSSDLFNQFLTTGIGAKPIIAAYENQLIEFSVAHTSQQSLIRQNIRILYPRPTVLSEHVLISLDDKGTKLLNALNDPEIQKLAWEQHGFRSGGLGTQNDPSTLTVLGVPRGFSATIPVPSFGVMDRILNTLAKLESRPL